MQLVEFDQLLEAADFVTIHSPATTESHHIIDREALEKMKPSAILINCARGPLIDPVALFAALRDGEIAAAGIDVTEVEPIDPEDPLLTLDNIIVTPHVAGTSPTSRAEGGRKQAENVLRILTGRPPHGLANPEVIKTIAVIRSTDHGRWKGIPDFSTELAL